MNRNRLFGAGVAVFGLAQLPDRTDRVLDTTATGSPTLVSVVGFVAVVALIGAGWWVVARPSAYGNGEVSRGLVGLVWVGALAMVLTLLL